MNPRDGHEEMNKMRSQRCHDMPFLKTTILVPEKCLIAQMAVFG
jgi:hypothetical protein